MIRPLAILSSVVDNKLQRLSVSDQRQYEKAHIHTVNRTHHWMMNEQIVHLNDNLFCKKNTSNFNVQLFDAGFYLVIITQLTLRGAITSIPQQDSINCFFFFNIDDTLSHYIHRNYGNNIIVSIYCIIVTPTESCLTSINPLCAAEPYPCTHTTSFQRSYDVVSTRCGRCKDVKTLRWLYSYNFIVLDHEKSTSMN